MKPERNPPPWQRPRREHKTSHVGVAWYTADEWAKVKSTAADPQRFEATFPEWEAMAERTLANLREAGVLAVKSFIVAEELLAWCRETGQVNDASARSQFVSEQERKTHEGDT